MGAGGSHRSPRSRHAGIDRAGGLGAGNLVQRPGGCGMTQANIRDREASRTKRVLKRERQAEATVERLPQLLPCMCPDCGAALGLAEPNEEVHCRNCGQWVAPDVAAS